VRFDVVYLWEWLTKEFDKYVTLLFLTFLTFYEKVKKRTNKYFQLFLMLH